MIQIFEVLQAFNPEKKRLALENTTHGPLQLTTIQKTDINCLQIFLSFLGLGKLADTKYSLSDVAHYLASFPEFSSDPALLSHDDEKVKVVRKVKNIFNKFESRYGYQPDYPIRGVLQDIITILCDYDPTRERLALLDQPEHTSPRLMRISISDITCSSKLFATFGLGSLAGKDLDLYRVAKYLARFSELITRSKEDDRSLVGAVDIFHKFQKKYGYRADHTLEHRLIDVREIPHGFGRYQFESTYEIEELDRFGRIVGTRGVYTTDSGWR